MVEGHKQTLGSQKHPSEYENGKHASCHDTKGQ